MSESKTVKDVVSNMRFTDMPLESLAYQCFIAQLGNPEVRKGQVELSVIAKRSFDAAQAFVVEAESFARRNSK